MDAATGGRDCVCIALDLLFLFNSPTFNWSFFSLSLKFLLCLENSLAWCVSSATFSDMFISDEYLLFSFWNIVFLVISLGSVGFFVLKAMKTPGKLQAKFVWRRLRELCKFTIA